MVGVKWNAKLFNLCLVWNTRLNAIGWISLQLEQTTNSWYWKFRILFQFTNLSWKYDETLIDRDRKNSTMIRIIIFMIITTLIMITALIMVFVRGLVIISKSSSSWWKWWWEWWTKWGISRKRVDFHINNHAASYKPAVSTQINENATKICQITSYPQINSKTWFCYCEYRDVAGVPNRSLKKSSYLEVEVIRLGRVGGVGWRVGLVGRRVGRILLVLHHFSPFFTTFTSV